MSGNGLMPRRVANLQNDRPMIVVVMGVSGSGKSAVGRRLAARLDWPFIEGDDLHPSANIEKMRTAVPLSDNDRAPWLQAVRERAVAQARRSGGVVVACSALRRVYRDVLRADPTAVWFACLIAPEDVLRDRADDRRHAFMPASLLASQLATFEPLDDDEAGETFQADQPLEAVVDEVEAVVRSLSGMTDGRNTPGG